MIPITILLAGFCAYTLIRVARKRTSAAQAMITVASIAALFALLSSGTRALNVVGYGLALIGVLIASIGVIKRQTQISGNLRIIMAYMLVFAAAMPLVNRETGGIGALAIGIAELSLGILIKYSLVEPATS
jgi:hypothetical protein